jgi:3-hydroxymyristoyl/3-hydroxydecanoyl-(acyl carrier protein) dehydratase
VRFLLFDRINEVEPGKRLAAVKVVSLTDDALADHYPRRAVLPPTLVLEALAQLSGMLNVVSNDYAVEMFLVLVERVTIARPVLHGESLALEVRARYAHEYGATMEGEARVDGELVAAAERIVFAHDVVTDPVKIARSRRRFAYHCGVPGPEPVR